MAKILKRGSLSLGAKGLIIVVIIVLGGFGWWYGSNYLFKSKINNNNNNTNNKNPITNYFDNNTIKYGQFVDVDKSNNNTGLVLIENQNGNYSLDFVNVSLEPGPDLYVYLSDKTSFTGASDTLGYYANLGTLPQNTGNFSINIPTNINISTYNSVLIYCLQFKVIFTAAPFKSV